MSAKSSTQRFGTMHLARSEHGNSSIEYALILALIAGCLIFGLDAVRFFHGTDQLTSHLSGGAHHGSSNSSQERADARVQEWQDAMHQVDPMFGMRIVTLGLLITTSLVALLVSRNQRKSQKASEVADEPVVEEKKQKQSRYLAKRQEILRTLSKDVRFLIESHVDVQRVMSNRVLVVPPNATYEEVATLMKENHVRHLLVTNIRGDLLGVISDRDVARSVVNASTATAQSIMTANPAYASPDTPIRTAISMMLDRHISCLPVVEDRRPVGILTTTDLTMMLQCAMQLLEQLNLTVGAPAATPAQEAEVDDEALVGASI